MQFTDKYKDRVYNWARYKKAGVYPTFDYNRSPILKVPNEKGEETCRIGDYLIAVSEPTATSWGKLSVCKQDIFEQLYEPVEWREGRYEII